jgi:hypothetical protein
MSGRTGHRSGPHVMTPVGMFRHRCYRLYTWTRAVVFTRRTRTRSRQLRGNRSELLRSVQHCLRGIEPGHI